MTKSESPLKHLVLFRSQYCGDKKIYVSKSLHIARLVQISTVNGQALGTGDWELQSREAVRVTGTIKHAGVLVLLQENGRRNCARDA